MYNAKILRDSLSPDGVRLTTFQVTYPHAVHKDLMTHRVFSRNFLSFRAYPSEKLEGMLTDENCYKPEVFQERRKGMSGGSALPEEVQGVLRALWLAQKNHAVETMRSLVAFGVAKEQANILVQDFCWITGIVTATEWDNFFALRLDTHDDGTPKARPEVYKIAQMMRELYNTYEPSELRYGDWHLPLVDPSEWTQTLGDWSYWKKVSVGRCARVSYLTHDGVRDPNKDVELHDMLKTNGHLSPFEHVARPWEPGPLGAVVQAGHPASNFNGWHQYRKDIPNEANFGAV